MTPQELKNSILQLAIQGKLVEQRPEEGTAEELYQQIQEEKQRLIKAGKVKKEKAMPEISEDEKPFDIPESWRWVRLGELLRVISGVSYKKNDVSANGLRILRGGNIQNGKVILEEDDVFLPSVYDDQEKRVQNGDIVVVASTGSKAVIGKAGYIEEELPNTMIGAFLRICRPYFQNTANYLHYIFDSGYYRKHIRALAQGTNINNVKESHITEFIIPLPSLAEQKRIVAKIEELLPYIDRYEQTWSRLEDFNKRFPDDMKKSILQLAIQGKLVAQRPEDGTGEELYQRIQEEKQRLIKAGKIKKEKPLPEIAEDEKPFDIPENWKWIKIGDIFSVVRGSSPRPKGSPLYWANIETEFNWITIKDISTNTQDGILLKTIEHLTAEGARLSTYIEKGEVIIAVSGSTTGKHCILGIDGYIYDGLAAVLNPTKIVSNKYVYYFFSWIYGKLNSKKIGSAFPNINTDILKNTLMPLPPFAEQKRIVATLEELLPLCERLK